MQQIVPRISSTAVFWIRTFVSVRCGSLASEHGCWDSTDGRKKQPKLGTYINKMKKWKLQISKFALNLIYSGQFFFFFAPPPPTRDCTVVCPFCKWLEGGYKHCESEIRCDGIDWCKHFWSVLSIPGRKCGTRFTFSNESSRHGELVLGGGKKRGERKADIKPGSDAEVMRWAKPACDLLERLKNQEVSHNPDKLLMNRLFFELRTGVKEAVLIATTPLVRLPSV